MGTIQERVNKNGKKSYRAQIRLNGHRPKSVTFQRKTDARRWIQQTESDIRQNRHFDTEESKKHTFSDLVSRYSKEILIHKKSARTPLQNLAWWQERIGHLPLGQVP